MVRQGRGSKAPENPVSPSSPPISIITTNIQAVLLNLFLVFIRGFFFPIFFHFNFPSSMLPKKGWEHTEEAGPNSSLINTHSGKTFFVCLFALYCSFSRT